MPPHASTNHSDDGTSDLACTRCRERKIRCGRERPTCSHCEREPEATCQYKHPAKRVNHLKLLCDSVERLQSRLAVMESHLIKPDCHPTGNTARHATRSSPKNRNRADSSGYEDDDGMEDSETDSSSTSPHSNMCSELHISRSEVDQVDRWHGPSSLFVLCNRLRQKFLGQAEAGHLAEHVQQMFRDLCDGASNSEPFPSFNTKPLDYLVPKQQAVTAVEVSFCHLDYTTDLFDKTYLLHNLERVYSSPSKPHDKVWAVCFRVLVLLVLGHEISPRLSRSNDGLFGDFARSFLPSRTELVNSQLLTTPRLVNVQTLILLSVAAQQFDTLDWAELLFTHACILARTMGLHHAQICIEDGCSPESLERAKVLRALYCRDKNLFTHFGCMPWLPTRDKHILGQLNCATTDQGAYTTRIRLAMIQDEIYNSIHASAGKERITKSKSRATLRRVERHLSEFAESLELFKHLPDHPAYNKLLVLEFLSTRILALHLLAEKTHATQILRDARASCCLLLMSIGSRSTHLTQDYASAVGNTFKSSSSTDDQSHTDPADSSISGLMDAFSAPAFFVLFETSAQLTKGEVPPDSAFGDIEMLRGVAKFYADGTAQMQPNSYHCKAARVFGHLLALIDYLTSQASRASAVEPSVAPIANMIEPAADNHSRDLTREENTDSVHGSLMSTPSMASLMDWDGIFSPTTYRDDEASPISQQINLALNSGNTFGIGVLDPSNYDFSDMCANNVFMDLENSPNLKRRRVSRDPMMVQSN